MTAETTTDAPKFKAGDLAVHRDHGLAVLDDGELLGIPMATILSGPEAGKFCHAKGMVLKKPTRLELQAHGLLEDVEVGAYAFDPPSRRQHTAAILKVVGIDHNGWADVRWGSDFQHSSSPPADRLRLATPQELHDHGIIDTIPDVPRCECGDLVALCGGTKCVEEAQAMLAARGVTREDLG